MKVFLMYTCAILFFACFLLFICLLDCETNWFIPCGIGTFFFGMAAKKYAADVVAEDEAAEADE